MDWGKFVNRSEVRPQGFARSMLVGILLGWVLASVMFCYASCTAFGLSNGRVYEMVTPLYKGGYGGVLEAAAPNGESAVFTSPGGFANVPSPSTGNAYVARRIDGVEWRTQALQPPFILSNASEFSSKLESVLTGYADSNGNLEIWQHSLELPDTAEYWQLVGMIENTTQKLSHIEELGANDDLCHVIVEQVGGVLPPGALVSVPELYDLSTGCRGAQKSYNLVAVTNGAGVGGAPELISKVCAPVFGGNGVPPTDFNAISGNGEEVFFGVNVEQGASQACTTGTRQVFVRLGGERTVEVSRPLNSEEPFGGCGLEGEVPCAGAADRPSAFFSGASEDGSVVFFTTTADLLSGGPPSENQLYMARIGCPAGESECSVGSREVTSLVRVSEDPTPTQAADVVGVVDVAPNGGAVDFVAHGVLTSASNDEGEVASDGADNLYAYDTSTGKLEFIADVCSGPSASGEKEDQYCPRSLNSENNDTGLWGGFAEAQVTNDGGVLVFSSFGRLVRRGPDADTDAGRDTYRFDLATGGLARVSIGEKGFGGNGNGEGFNATIPVSGYGPAGAHVPVGHEMGERAVSGNGSWIVFTTSEPLSAGASNGLSNVYAWHETEGSNEGTVSLISSGNSSTNDFNPVIAPETVPDGRDIFFMTSAGLIPEDTENDLDVYDARIGGGFPGHGVGLAQCSSDACQGPLSAPVPTLVPGSMSQPPGGNYSPVPPEKKAKPKKIVVKHPKKHKKAKAKRKKTETTHHAKSGRRVVSVRRSI